MTTLRIPAALAAATLVLALAVVPARAAEEALPQPTGVRTLLRYASCAISVAIMTNPLSFAGAFFNCGRLMLEEIERDAAR